MKSSFEIADPKDLERQFDQIFRSLCLCIFDIYLPGQAVFQPEHWKYIFPKIFLAVLRPPLIGKM